MTLRWRRCGRCRWRSRGVDASTGWIRVAHPDLLVWAKAARPVARAALAVHPDRWRAGGTWQAGVDALPNDAEGALAGADFPWHALPLTPAPLHPAQLSTCLPGYPRPDGDDAAHRWRLARDNAHLDGLIPEGPLRRRYIREPHAWILGLPLTEADPGASPLVVWEGSHRVLRTALLAALAPHPPETWSDIDITDAYVQARRLALATCPRRELPARPGEATLIHRLILHGVAPWAEGARAAAGGRIIAYFRPLLPSVADWLAQGDTATTCPGSGPCGP